MGSHFGWEGNIGTFVLVNEHDLTVHTGDTLVSAVREPKDPSTQLAVYWREVLVCLVTTSALSCSFSPTPSKTHGLLVEPHPDDKCNVAGKVHGSDRGEAKHSCGESAQ